MDQKELQNLIRFISKSGVAEVSYKTDQYELKVKNILPYSNHQIVHTSQPLSVPDTSSYEKISTQDLSEDADKSENKEDSKYVVIKSPMIGTFYRKPSPDKPSFVNVGDNISKGKVVCVIEAMKLFNEIESDINGKIVEIFVEDSMPVEFDQPLFLIDPS